MWFWQRWSPVIGAGIVCFLCSLGMPRAEETVVVGDRAPWFKLQNVHGKIILSRELKNRSYLLVVGRTQKAAPPCKKWMLALIKRFGKRLPIFQVIVVDKAWYIPRSWVLDKVKNFCPIKHHHRVLLEWYSVFADLWHVKKHDQPVVFFIDYENIIRWRFKGQLKSSTIDMLERVIAEDKPEPP